MYIYLLACLLFTLGVVGLGTRDVAFVIVTQDNDYIRDVVEQLEKDLRSQAEGEIHLNITNKSGDWTILPLLPHFNTNVQWVVLLQDNIKVSVQLLMNVLDKYDPNEEILLGHASHDAESTIIHHFNFHENPQLFKYPNLASGIILSRALITSLNKRLELDVFNINDFHIDPAYEFALFVYNDGHGPMIVHDEAFCAKRAENCATFPVNFQGCGPSDINSIYFAVKTCKIFHKDRIKVLQKTWLPFTSKKTLFSDIDDPKIPTKSTWVPNTKTGHCQKTLEILHHALIEFEQDSTLEWLALVDDDTILSVSRLLRLTSCHSSYKPLILGERYRYQSFDYPTGGAGIIISKPAVEMLQHCSCPKVDAPDDMVIGACSQELGVTLVHVAQMHQARVEDYPDERLANGDAISFHKHWMSDPVKTYQRWFLEEDVKLGQRDNSEL